MPRSFFSELSPSGRSLGAAITGGGGIRANADLNATRTLANQDYLSARADLVRAQTLKAQQGTAPEDPNALTDAAAMAAGVDIPTARSWRAQQTTGQMPVHSMGETGGAPEGSPQGAAPVITPELEQALRAGLADLMTQKVLTGKTNFEQLQAGKGKKIQNTALQEALDGIDTDDTGSFARKTTLGTGHTVAPYRTSAQGVTTDEMSGDVNEDSQLAEAARNKLDSQADLYDAKADQADAKKTGQAALDPAEIRTFKAYKEIFPQKSDEEILGIVKGKRSGDPTEQMAKDQRAIQTAHPRWTPEQVNEAAGKLQAGRNASQAKPATAAAPAPAGGKRQPTQADRDYIKAHPEKRQKFIDTFGVNP